MTDKPSKSDRRFSFFESYRDVFRDLEPNEKVLLLDAMLEFVFDGVEPELPSRELRLVFRIMRPSLERSIRNGKNGANGGAPYGNQNAAKNAGRQDKETDEDEDKDRDIDVSTEKQATNNRKTTEKQPTDLSFSLYALDHLNKRIGSKYTPTGRAVELLTVLEKSGYTLDQVKTVIDRKCDEWLDVPKMKPQLTPAVLFKLENFERYLQSAPSIKEEQRITRAETKAIKEQDALDEVRRLEDEYNRLKEQYDNMPEETEQYKMISFKRKLDDVQMQIEMAKRKLNQLKGENDE